MSIYGVKSREIKLEVLYRHPTVTTVPTPMVILIDLEITKRITCKTWLKCSNALRESVSTGRRTVDHCGSYSSFEDCSTYSLLAGLVRLAEA